MGSSFHKTLIKKILAKAKLILGENEREYILEFAVQQRAVTPGQAAVFYLGDVVLGGGEIY